MTDPINPAATEAWAALSHHRSAFHASLRDLFHDDPQRADHMTYQVADLTVDGACFHAVNLRRAAPALARLDLANDGSSS